MIIGQKCSNLLLNHCNLVLLKDERVRKIMLYTAKSIGNRLHHSCANIIKHLTVSDQSDQSRRNQDWLLGLPPDHNYSLVHCTAGQGLIF